MLSCENWKEGRLSRLSHNQSLYFSLFRLRSTHVLFEVRSKRCSVSKHVDSLHLLLLFSNCKWLGLIFSFYHYQFVSFLIELTHWSVAFSLRNLSVLSAKKSDRKCLCDVWPGQLRQVWAWTITRHRDPSLHVWELLGLDKASFPVCNKGGDHTRRCQGI